jgi:hypothetical protein
MNIVVHIERLVLDGIPLTARDHEALRTALGEELTRQLASGIHPDLRAGGAVPARNGGGIELPRGASATQVGSQVAGAVRGAIGTEHGRS